MKQAGRTGPILDPAISHQLRGRTSVNIYDQGNLPRRAFWRKQELAVQGRPVVSFELKELGRGQFVIVDAARLPYVLTGVVGAANQGARGCHQGGEFVDERLAVAGEYGVMGSIFV